MKNLIVAFTFLWALSAHAGVELKGTNFEDTAKIDGKNLVLNGAGIREKSILAVSINVYVCALYLTKANSNADEVLASKDLKFLKSRFVRNVKVKDIRNAWVEGVETNCAEHCKDVEAAKQKLLDAMVDIKEGDYLNYKFTANSVDVLLNDKSIVKIDDPHMPAIMLKTWLGQKPISEGLKKKLLGAGLTK
jgi:long-chain acyl-CoA synthetase